MKRGEKGEKFKIKKKSGERKVRKVEENEREGNKKKGKINAK